MKKLLFISLVFAINIFAKELKVIGPLEIKGLEPTKAGYMYSRLQIAENLISVNEKGELTPNLATSWSSSKDGLKWIINLRKNVKFHDGSSFDSKIVAYNLNREELLKKSILRYLPLKNIVAKDTHTLEINLNSPFHILPAYFVHYSTVILGENSFDKDGKVTQVIGTGAFEITKVTAPIAIKAKRFDKWWKGQAKVEKVAYNAVGKNETRALMMKTKEAHIAFSLLPISLKSLRKDPNLNTEVVTIFRTRKLKLNAASEFLSDVKVRHAISSAIDRKGISKVILQNESLAATQMLSPSIPAWYNTEIKPLTQDIKKAKSLLKEAGWLLKEDGYVYKNGKKFAIDLITYSNWPELPLIATAIQNQLKEIGIDLKVSITNASEVVRRHKDNTLQLALVSKNFNLVPNPLSAIIQTYGEKGSSWGAMNWKNEKMFKHLDTLTKKAKPELHKEITKILQDDLPAIPVTWSDLAVVSTKKVKNLKVDHFEISYNLSDVSLD